MLALLAGAGLLTSGPWVRRGVGLAVGLAACGAPIFLPREPAVLVFVLTVGSAWGFLRVVDLARMEVPFGAARRVAHVFATEDTRKLERGEAGVLGHGARLFAWAAAATAAGFLVFEIGPEAA